MMQKFNGKKFLANGPRMKFDAQNFDQINFCTIRYIHNLLEYMTALLE